MAVTATTRWKEELIITDEEGRSFTFDCGWGADPLVAFVPLADQWQDCVPGWLWDRRAEVVEAMKEVNHRVVETRYPPLEEQRA